MFESKVGQRIGGLIVLVLGAGAAAWTWHSALSGETYYPKIGAFGTALLVPGLGMILCPMDIEQLRIEHGVHKPAKLQFRHYPLIWKAITVIAACAGVIGFIALESL
jgi:hypothetical protein